MKPTPDYRPHRFQNISVEVCGWNAVLRGQGAGRRERGCKKSLMPKKQVLIPVTPMKSGAPLIDATQSEQAGRYAEILWLEQKLIGPLRPHKEDRLCKALANTEAVYEAQWLELEMAVGTRTAFKVRRRVEAQQERQRENAMSVSFLRSDARN